MKNKVLLVLFVVIVGMAFANPLEPLYICRFWFDASGELNARFNEQWSQAWEADLFDGVNHYQRQIDPDNPATFTQVYPDAVCTAQAGYLQITNLTYPAFPEEVHWGSGATDQITPLTPGQCGIQFYYADGVENTVKLWGKDLITNPVTIWDPTQTSTLRIFCHNQSGAGIAGVPVYLYSPYNHWQNTDATGWVNHSIASARWTVFVKNPQTQSIAYQTTYFAEPGQTYDIDLQMAGSASGDPLQQVPASTFTALPTVLRNGDDRMLRLGYDGKITDGLQTELYDLKGRLIAIKGISAAETSWNLPKLSSGVYFLRLTESSRILGVKKLVVLR